MKVVWISVLVILAGCSEKSTETLIGAFSFGGERSGLDGVYVVKSLKFEGTGLDEQSYVPFRTWLSELPQLGGFPAGNNERYAVHLGKEEESPLTRLVVSSGAQSLSLRRAGLSRFGTGIHLECVSNKADSKLCAKRCLLVDSAGAWTTGPVVVGVHTASTPDTVSTYMDSQYADSHPWLLDASFLKVNFMRYFFDVGQFSFSITEGIEDIEVEKDQTVHVYLVYQKSEWKPVSLCLATADGEERSKVTFDFDYLSYKTYHNLPGASEWLYGEYPTVAKEFSPISVLSCTGSEEAQEP